MIRPFDLIVLSDCMGHPCFFDTEAGSLVEGGRTFRGLFRQVRYC